MDQTKNDKQNFRHQKAEQGRKYFKYPGELIHLGKNNPKHIFDEEQKLGSSTVNPVRKIDFVIKMKEVPLFLSKAIPSQFSEKMRKLDSSGCIAKFNSAP